MSDLFVITLTVFMLTPLEDPTLFVGRLQTPPGQADATHLTGDDEAIPRAPGISLPASPHHCHVGHSSPLIKPAICCSLSLVLGHDKGTSSNRIQSISCISTIRSGRHFSAFPS